MHHYPFLVVQTGRTSTAIYLVESLTWGSWFIIIIIAITHLLDFWALITNITAPRVVPLLDSSTEDSRKANGTGVSIIAVAAVAPLWSATAVSVIVATAGSGLSRMLGGADARSGSICHCVCCMLGSLALGVSALHVLGIHSYLLFIIYCISISHHLKTSLSDLKIKPVILVPMPELWSMWKWNLYYNCFRIKFMVRVEIILCKWGLPGESWSNFHIDEVASGVRVVELPQFGWLLELGDCQS